MNLQKKIAFVTQFYNGNSLSKSRLIFCEKYTAKIVCFLNYRATKAAFHCLTGIAGNIATFLCNTLAFFHCLRI